MDTSEGFTSGLDLGMRGREGPKMLWDSVGVVFTEVRKIVGTADLGQRIRILVLSILSLRCLLNMVMSGRQFEAMV